jgi:hypothetical protein
VSGAFQEWESGNRRKTYNPMTITNINNVTGKNFFWLSARMRVISFEVKTAPVRKEMVEGENDLYRWFVQTYIPTAF